MINLKKTNNLIKNNKEFVLLETLKPKSKNNFLFTDPIEKIIFKTGDDLSNFFNKIENYTQQGFYTAGYFTYEFGCLLEEKLQHLIPKNTILAELNVYKKRTTLKNNKKQNFNISQNYKIKNLQLSETQTQYINNIKKIKKYLSAGDVYQINYTTRFNFNFTGSALDLYNKLRHMQSASYCSLIQTQNKTIVSLSPELFFNTKNNTINVKPMKGTIKRGKNIHHDASQIKELKHDLKNQSENVMIVDLMRNDISKICKTGTVKTTSLYDIEKYETLFQMTSNIQGKLNNNTKYHDIIKAIFPCGSITGAPKIRAMQIINELEKTPRNVYTGAIGFFGPNNEAIFNVAIRTIELKQKKGTIGIGSGIVFDSNAKKEYEECLLKADFLTKPYKPFFLIETIRWSGKYFLLNLHLKRLKDSAQYFGFNFSENKIKTKLKQTTQKLNKEKTYKIRLLLYKDGEIKIEKKQIKLNKKNTAKIKISKKILNSSNIFLYHKTSNRDLYNTEYKKATDQNFDEVIFFNEKGELTEGAISNIIIEKNKKLYTPHTNCGLLNGVYRQHLLNNKKIQEKILYKKDLESADKIFICNSVKGLQACQQIQ